MRRAEHCEDHVTLMTLMDEQTELSLQAMAGKDFPEGIPVGVYEQYDVMKVFLDRIDAKVHPSVLALLLAGVGVSEPAEPLPGQVLREDLLDEGQTPVLAKYKDEWVEGVFQKEAPGDRYLIQIEGQNRQIPKSDVRLVA